MDDNTKRLGIVATILESLCMYNFTDREEEFEDTLREFAIEFAHAWAAPEDEVLELRKGESAKVFCRAYPPRTNTEFDEKRLKYWERKAIRLAEEVRKDPIYQELKNAYNSNNQEKIRDLVSSVWSDVTPIDSIKRREWRRARSGDFFHGVLPVSNPELATQSFDRGLISPSDYVDRCIRIMNEGLRPGTGLRSMPMDENIRPIYVTPDKRIAASYGPLFFMMRPQDTGFFIWTINDNLSTAGEEMGVYTPRLLIPMTLSLSLKYGLETHDEKDREKYLREIKKEFGKRKIPLKLEKNE